MWRKPATVVCLSLFSWSGEEEGNGERKKRKKKKKNLIQSRSIHILSAYLTDIAGVLCKFEIYVVDVGVLHNEASVETLGMILVKHKTSK